MPTYTTADRVRRAIGYSDPDLTNTAIDEFIDDTEAYLIVEVGRTITPADGYVYNLMVAAATLGAAIRAIIIPIGGVVEGLDYSVDEIRVNKSAQLQAKLKTASQYRIDANNYIAALKVDDTSLPISNTQLYG